MENGIVKVILHFISLPISKFLKKSIQKILQISDSEMLNLPKRRGNIGLFRIVEKIKMS
ncbi:25756_t:CDS:1, partial [Dentiscutata erythropus]